MKGVIAYQIVNGRTYCRLDGGDHKPMSDPSSNWPDQIGSPWVDIEKLELFLGKDFLVETDDKDNWVGSDMCDWAPIKDGLLCICGNDKLVYSECLDCSDVYCDACKRIYYAMGYSRFKKMLKQVIVDRDKPASNMEGEMDESYWR